MEKSIHYGDGMEKFTSEELGRKMGNGFRYPADKKIYIFALDEEVIAMLYKQVSTAIIFEAGIFTLNFI